MNGAIAIFVKTPGYSALKTRLAAAVGDAVATEWHRRASATVAAVARAAAAASGAAVYWAVAEPAAVAARAWDDLENLAQGTGGLGARMGRVHAELVRRHGAGLLLGADAPQLTAAALVEALAWCAAPAARHAIGPAHDGGFWLYAGNRVVAPWLWDGVTYSRPDTARGFRQAFDAVSREWLVLPTLTDLDEGADLPALRRELGAVPAPLPAQVALATWLAATVAVDPRARAAQAPKVSRAR